MFSSKTSITVHLNMSQRENGQLPLAKPTVRSRIPSESWEQTKPPTHPASVCARVARNSRSHDAVIRVYDDAGDVIETHEHAGDFKDSFSSGFLTVLQKTSPATQQPMGLENRFDCHSSLQQKLIAMSRTPTLVRKLLRLKIMSNSTLIRIWTPTLFPLTNPDS